MTDISTRLLVIVPTYNERDNLPLLIEGLLRTPEVRVLVVDDGSPDGTGEVADTLARHTQSRVSVLRRTSPRGFGLSHIDGLIWGLATDATVFCQMDADLSHDPADVPRLVAATKGAELVIGSRYVRGGRIENWPRRRLVLSAFANQYIRTITRLRPRDCTSGFRCWTRNALERLPLRGLTSNGYAFQVELLWEAAAAGCRVVEVPITFVERRQGVSKLSARVIMESALMPWHLALRRSRR